MVPDVLPELPSHARARHSLFGLFRGAEYVLVVVALLLLTVGEIPGMRQRGAGSADEGDPLIQSLYRIIYLLAAVGLAANWRAAIRAVRGHPWTLIFVAFAACSWVWSEMPADTLRRSLSLLGTSFVGLYLCIRFDLSTAIKLLAWSLGLAALFSLAAGVAWPSVGLAQGTHLGAWTGIFRHKNVLGRAMVLGVAAFLYLLLVQRRRWIPAGGLLLCALLVALSTSKTAAVVGAGIILATPLYNALRSPRAGAWVTALIATVVGGSTVLLIAMHQEDFFSKVGRDATLTGRTDLWEAARIMIAERPLLGYGYGGFWSDRSDHAFALFEMVRWQPPHAHNGFLDLGLDLGLVGIGLFALSFVLVFGRALVALSGESRSEALWVVIFLTFLLLYNMTENTLLRQGTVFWALYIVTAARTSYWTDDTPAASQEPGAPAVLSPGVPRLRRRRGAPALPSTSVPT
jgi:exopolysaccharide production protein ExoQ